MALIRVLTRKLNNNEVVQKCMNVFKTLLSYSYDKEEEDLVIEGVTTMYEHLLDTFTADTLHLLAYHCMRSYRLRALLRKKECKIQQIVHKYSKDEHYSEVCRLTVFLILNQEEPILFTIA